MELLSQYLEIAAVIQARKQVGCDGRMAEDDESIKWRVSHCHHQRFLRRDQLREAKGIEDTVRAAPLVRVKAKFTLESAVCLSLPFAA